MRTQMHLDPFITVIDPWPLNPPARLSARVFQHGFTFLESVFVPVIPGIPRARTVRSFRYTPPTEKVRRGKIVEDAENAKGWTRSPGAVGGARENGKHYRI